MKKLLAFLLAGVSGLAAAQTPARNPMPDGSGDMYVGLGASVQPRYEGASEHRTRAAPLLQVEFSNGVFLSGMQAGWHLARQAALECGPLLAVHAGRDESGGRGGVIDVFPAFVSSDRASLTGNRLAGQPEIKARLTGGAFLNYYLAPRLRLNNSVLYGAGGDGLAWEASVQAMAAPMASPHRLSLSAGVTLVNRAYSQAFFGVPAERLRAPGVVTYSPDGGVKDLFVVARWNWALSPAWIVSSSVRAQRLSGDARNSPLVERSGQISITSGLAHRF